MLEQIGSSLLDIFIFNMFGLVMNQEKSSREKRICKETGINFSA